MSVSETPNLDKWIQSIPDDPNTPLLDYLDQCSNTANFSAVSADLPTLSSDITATNSKPLATAILTNRRSPHIPDISQESKSTETSQNSSQKQESLTLSPVVFHALGQVRREAEQGLNTKSLDYGEKVSELCVKSNPDISSGNNLWELPLEVYEQSLELQEWQVIRSRVLRSPLQNLGQHTNEKEFLRLPTLTTGTGTTRNAGRTKLEDKLKKLGILKNGYQLSPEAMAMFMGFKWDLFEPITGVRLLSLSGLSPTDYHGVMMPADWQGKQLLQLKRRSPSIGSVTEKKRGRPRGSTGKASGSLTPFTETKNLKTYPIVTGDRVPKDLAADYPHQFFWFYQFKFWDKDRDIWLTKSKRVRSSQVITIKYLVQSKHSVNCILEFINTGKINE